MPKAFSYWVAIEAVTLAFLFANWFWKPRVRNPSIRAGLFWGMIVFALLLIPATLAILFSGE